MFHHSRRQSLRLPSAKPTLEALESRIVPYVNSGNVWPHPQLITISFVPDGTVLAQGNGGYITSNLFSTFNAKFQNNTAGWENVILKAAQTWAASANVNFTVVPDDGSSSGSGLDQQGASNFGDIRIGGYNFGYDWLAGTFYPPPVNNYSVAGDVDFNTAYSFNIGSTYDLFTVAAHEIGHSLGLGESSSTTAVMFTPYNGAHRALGTDDVNGIHAIYGARPADGSNNSFATATNITSTIDPVLLTSVVNNLNISSTSAADYFSFTAPDNSSSNMTVTVQSTGLSLFTPSVTVYAADQQTVLGSNIFQLASGAVEDGATLSVNVSGVTPGTTYYVEVQGADSSVFSTGAYALTLNLGTGANPSVPLPNTQTLNGSPEKAGGGQADVGDPATPSGAVTAADANVVRSLINRQSLTAATAPTPVTQGTGSALALPVSASVPGAAAVPVERGLAGSAGEAVEVAGAPAASSPQGTDSSPQGTDAPRDATPVAPPQVVPGDDSEAVNGPEVPEAWLAIGFETPDALSASAPVVAEATASDWTPSGALAAASVLFAGTWLRYHGAHKNEEDRRHALPVRDKQDVS